MEFATLRKISAYLIIVLTLLSGFFFLRDKESKMDLDPLKRRSPAYGRVVATAIHQGLSDPYLVPLENLAHFMNKQESIIKFSVDIMAKWAPDNEFPTCFVYDLENMGWQIDHPASPWVLDEVAIHIGIYLQKNLDNRGLYMEILDVDGEKWWLGMLLYPPEADSPLQAIGVFFSLKRYLEKDVPRLIDAVVNRSRFPLFDFQQTMPIDKSLLDGDISFRILTKEGNIFFQRGRNFGSDQLIYSESQWYDQTLVCLQKDWDLQIFSANVEVKTEKDINRKLFIFLGIAFMLISLSFWLGMKPKKQITGK